MITRNKFRPGYYANLVKGFSQVEHHQKSCKQMKMKMKKANETNLNGLIKLINYNILKKLKSNRKGSPNCQMKYNIENKVFNFLKNRFQLNSRFKECDEFLAKYHLEHERCQNERYYSIASNFEFKINKGRKLKFNQIKNGKIVSRKISSNHTLSVSFFVANFP